MRRLRVLIDTNILVDAQLRDLFLSLADREFFDYLWSEQILAELQWVLVERLGRPPPKARRLCDAIRRAFPLGDTSVDDALISQFATPDPDDTHVLAAAVHGEADILLTADRAGFPSDEVIGGWDLELLSAGEALDMLIATFGSEPIAAVFADITGTLTNPPVDLSEQLRRLETTSHLAAISIGSALGVADYQDLLNDAARAMSPDDPRAAVHRLVDCVRDSDLDGIDDILTPEEQRRLARSQRGRRRVLRELLAGVLEARGDWGYGTAHRPLGPNEEIVKLVRMPTLPTGGIISEPTLVEAIVFSVFFDAERWLVNGVGIPDPAETDPGVRPA